MVKCATMFAKQTKVNDVSDWFPNYAGVEDIDELLIKELDAAGIPYSKLPECCRDRDKEISTIVIGDLHGWGFLRNWSYWVATGPGIPPEYATPLHELHGQSVRVAGHCGCPSPLEWFNGFAVGNYHVDTFSGLKALVDTINLVVEDAKKLDILPQCH